MTNNQPTDLAERCEAIESCYEYLLGYAAQGLADERSGRGGSQVRDLLGGAVQAVAGLAEACARLVAELGLEPTAKYEAFLAVLRQDADRALAVLELVLAQPRLSSQLIDSLNASLHLRTILTDLFLLDEVVKIHHAATRSG